MDPKLSTNERKLREDILQHEFPFDEKAWTSMEALLHQGKNPEPGSGLPPKHLESLPGPSRNWTLMLVLLSAFSLGAASLFWWDPLPEKALSTTEFKNPSHIPPLENVEAREQTESVVKLDALSSPGKTSQQTHLTPQHQTVKTSQQAHFTPQHPTVNHSNSSDSPNRAISGSKVSRQSESTSYWEPSRLKTEINPSESGEGFKDGKVEASGEIANTSSENQAAAAPFIGVEPLQETDLSQVLFDLALLPIPGIGEIEHQEQALTVLDSLIQPIKKSPASIHRRHRGWILGLNANTVDNNPVRLSVLPHLGYFTSYPLSTKTRIQADFVLKYVSGYQLSAKFMDIIPGGSSTVILNTNNVLYLEIPLVMKREYRPDYSWMLGLKPSGNFKIFPGGEYLSANNSPSRFINSQAGFRSFDLGLVLGWEWRYHKYWALDIRYNQGLLDLTHDSFYRDNSTLLNSDLQVSLRYTPSKKNRHHAPKTLFPPPAGQ